MRRSPSSLYQLSSRAMYALTLAATVLLFTASGSSYASDKVPGVMLSVKSIDTENPTVEGIMAAGQLGGQLYPTEDIVGDKTLASKYVDANRSFASAMEQWNRHNYREAARMLRKHIADYPDSPWVSEAVLHLGCDAQYNGRYSEAESWFTTILEKDAANPYHGAQRMVNKATLRLGVLNVFERDFARASELFTKLKAESGEWRDRTYASHWLGRISRYRSVETAMLNCGTLALADVIDKDGRTEDAMKVRGMHPVTEVGQSMSELRRIASGYGYTLTGIHSTPEGLLDAPLPAIVQISARSNGDTGHYWVLESHKDGVLQLFDPQAGRRFWQSCEQFGVEWDGNALVLAKADYTPTAGFVLTEADMDNLVGGCCGVPRPEDGLGGSGGDGSGGDDGLPDPDGPDFGGEGDPPPSCGAGPMGDDGPAGGGTGASYGAPKWSVNPVNMNIFMTDTPIWYDTAIGPDVRVMISYNSQSAIAANEPFGNKWQFNYTSYLVVDTGGQVTVFMPDGRRDVYSPDGQGGYTGPVGVFNTLSKLAENLFLLTMLDGMVCEYDIPAGTGSLQPFLVKVSDSYNHSVGLGYDVNVRLATITDATGKVTTLTYNGSNRVTGVADPFGRHATFGYDVDGNLTSITDMGGYTTDITYDQDVYPTSVGNDRGTWTFYVEPADGINNGMNKYPAPGAPMWENYRITITNPLGDVEEYYYNGYSSYSWYVSPRFYIPYAGTASNNFATGVPSMKYGFTTVNGAGRLSYITYPDNGVVYYNYDVATGRRTSVTDQHNHTTHNTFNPRGMADTFTDAKGTVTTRTYYPNGYDLQSISDVGGTVSFTVDAHHNATGITYPSTAATGHTYDADGLLTASTDALGRVTTYTYYDATTPQKRYRLKEITRDGLAQESYDYDTRGRISSYTDPEGITRTYTYNDLDAVTMISYPDGKYEEFTYSTCCPRLLESVRDRAGNMTMYEYDALLRVSAVTGADGTRTVYEYDKNGNISALIDANGNRTGFVYDTMDRMTWRLDEGGNTETYTYDTAGLLTQRKNARGITAAFTYDQNHNLTGVNYSDTTPDSSYTYNTANLMTSRNDGVGAYSFTYDADARLQTVDGPWANDTLTYSYDAAGKLTGISVSDGYSVTYGFDTLDRRTTVTRGGRTFTYAYPVGSASQSPETLTMPSGAVTAYSRDLMGRMTGISTVNASLQLITSSAFTYGANDRRATETITNGGPSGGFEAGRTDYAYDDLNRMLSASDMGAFTYDADGNLTGGYTPEGYAFTAAYDAEDRLATLTYTDGSQVQHNYEFRYSADGFLAVMVVDGDETRFVRSRDRCIEERDSGDATQRSMAWGIDLGGGIGGLVEMTQDGQNYSFAYDGNGNVVRVLDSTSGVVASYVYDTFGSPISVTGSVEQPYMFSTKPYIAEAGLSYYGLRFYYPAAGRWLTRDPIGESGGINLYGFVGNDPVNDVDPMGAISRWKKGFIYAKRFYEWVKGVNNVAGKTETVVKTVTAKDGGEVGGMVGGIAGEVITGCAVTFFGANPYLGYASKEAGGQVGEWLGKKVGGALGKVIGSRPASPRMPPGYYDLNPNDGVKGTNGMIYYK